jgi:hypothetical protein
MIDGKPSTEKVDYGTNVLTYLETAVKAEDEDATYAFSHWEVGGVEVDANATVESDKTYTAVFTPTYKRFLITFDVAGNISSQKINVGEPVVQYLPTNTNRPNDEANGII